MIDQRKIPSGYTGCEEYRGYVIAIKGGSYSVFAPNGDKMYSYLKGGFDSRADARRAIDLEFA